VPYEDGHALESYFVELIDTAEHHVQIVNPYLNLTPKLALAFDRPWPAASRSTLSAASTSRATSAASSSPRSTSCSSRNMATASTFREFKAPDVVLHSKIMMIDDRLVTILVGHLNNCSFFHDSENGMTVLDPAFYHRMKPVYDDYLAHSKPGRHQCDDPWAYRLLFSQGWVKQAF